MLEQTLRRVMPQEAFFWSVHSGMELDLFYLRDGKRYGVEFKWSDAPRLTPSMKSACDLLKLDRLWVVYPGNTPYELTRSIAAVPAARLDLLSERS
jgi:predicted AAA+ superfamily ATPase